MNKDDNGWSDTVNSAAKIYLFLFKDHKTIKNEFSLVTAQKLLHKSQE